jgi:nicotinamide mononucleotide (NMN) deamidase PncC
MNHPYSSSSSEQLILEPIPNDKRQHTHLNTYLQRLSAQILTQLSTTNQTLALAESLTGGLLSTVLTDIPGSSRSLRGSIVAYSNEAKTRLLDVRSAVLEGCGSVSFECAEEMALGVVRRLGCDWGVSTTGFAGSIVSISDISTYTDQPQGSGSDSSIPDSQRGGSGSLLVDGIHVDKERSKHGKDGLVYIHVVGPGGVSVGRRFQFEGGTRYSNRWDAVENALLLLHEQLVLDKVKS